MVAWLAVLGGERMAELARARRDVAGVGHQA
jgi:hypothetical protein